MNADNAAAPETQAATPPANWIDTYVDWALKRSPLTPRHFHEGIAYTLASTAIAGRKYVQMPHEKVYPNLYTLILGQTSVFAKSVALSLAWELCEQAGITDRIIRAVFTPEALLNELSGKKPKGYKKWEQDQQTLWKLSQNWGACRTIWADEAGRIFNAFQRDYNADMPDVMMAMYDSRPLFRLSVKHGLTATGNTCPSCLFATTPEGIRRWLSKTEFWLSGFWPRWNFYVETKLQPFQRAVFGKPPINLVAQLSKLNQMTSGEIGIDKAVTEDHDAMIEQARHRIHQANQQFAVVYLARLHTKRIKLATILAVLEGAPSITRAHWDIAGPAVEQMHTGAMLVQDLMQDTETEALRTRIRTQLWLATDHTMTTRELQRKLHVSLDLLMDALMLMVRAGEVARSTSGRL